MRAWLVVVLVACGAPAEQPIDGSSSGGGDDGSGSGSAMPDAPAATGACDGTTAQPLDATWTVIVGSAMRVVKVHVPASYDPRVRTPVVVDIHGRTGNAAAEMALTHSIAKSDAAGFIAIYPESSTTPTSWNAGTCCDPASSTNLDDTGYFRALLDAAEARLCVDTSRVYLMGISNGAYEAHRIGCELADRVAAIGPVAGLLLFAGCAPSRPVPVMMVNGTADTLSQYQYVGAGVDFWNANNGCTTQSTTYQHGDATCVTHGGCTNGADVVLCTIADGGHQWPGGETLPLLGKKSDDLIATDALWDFFVAHPKL